MSSVGYTDAHKGKGQDYHASFSPQINPYRAMVWRLEQRALDGILDTQFPNLKPAHLDFACGTGRVLGYLAGRVRSSTGVDVASSMLKVAMETAPGAELIEADLTQRDVLGNRSFDLITAFRFFPNAESELRKSVLEVMRRHLTPDGVVVFNNHKNRSSLRARISRFLGREAATRTMVHGEVQALVAEARLRIVRTIPLAILPLSEYHLLLPIALLEVLERRLGGLQSLVGVAQDIIYVCAQADRL